jgi:hypothetical protein
MGEGKIIVTGDTHSDFRRLKKLCEVFHLTGEDMIIILGDSGINLTPGDIDRKKKEYLSTMNGDHSPQIFALMGNHDLRPTHVDGYHLVPFAGGMAYRQDAFPTIYIARNSEVYEFFGRKYMALGGAYSVDRRRRLEEGTPWFEDEQMTEEEKQEALSRLTELNYSLSGGVLSHTVPFSKIPPDTVNSGAEWGVIDHSMEYFFQDLYAKLEEMRTEDSPFIWLAGHEHVDRRNGDVQILYGSCMFLGAEETFFAYDEIIENSKGDFAVLDIDGDGNILCRCISGKRLTITARTTEEAAAAFEAIK